MSAMGRSGLVCTAMMILGAVTTAPPVQAQEARSLTYVDLLSQLTNLYRLTTLQEGVRGGQFSSWDRGELQRWGSNGDAGKYLRVEDSGEAVMMEQDGPGCIYRVWSANPQGRIRVYLDGAAEPSFDWDFMGLFTGENPPFIKPLVYKRGDRNSASDCYLPIPFAKHIKITADRAHGQYYHFNYLRFPDDWQVPSFHLPLSDEEGAALQRAAEAWSTPGEDPKRELAGQQKVSKAFTIQPGETVELADLAGPGMICALRAEVSCEQRDFWRKLLLRAVWDDADWPQVLAPLGPFFGFDWVTPDYGSLIAGCRDGQCYFYLPMPFRRHARLELTSHLEMPAEVSFEVEWAPRRLSEDTVYFFARWRREPKCVTFDYPFLETAGRGHFVGVALQVDHPLPGWWGEGDEKVWIDDDDFPSWIGTGSEDYFGDAWGIRYLSEPSFGCSHDQYPRTTPYRWHFMDFIPFEKRLRMTIENYGSFGGAHRHDEFKEFDYSSVACWYQAELTPPFAELSGVEYTGGLVEGDAPQKLAYNPELFSDLNGGHLRTFGLDVPVAQEAEALMADAVWAGRAHVVTDAGRPYAFNMECALDFGQAQEDGQVLGEFTLSVPQSVVYYPRLYTAPQEWVAELSLEVEGQRLQITGRPQPHIQELEGIALEAGEHAARVVTASPGRALFDCLQLEPAPREAGAIEVEQLEVQVKGGGEAHPGPATRGVSGGQFLEWHATEPGDSLLIRLPEAPARSYVLGLRPMIGAGGGMVQAFVNGQPIGPIFDLYRPGKQPGDRILLLGQLPAGATEVEIRMVGKHPEAMGYHAGLDYFRWEPVILGPGTAEGVSAQVLRTQGCQYRIQDLSDAFFGGQHLWVQPSSRGAMIDIGLNIPEEGDYELAVRYTTSWDYAIVQASFDDVPVGDPVDCYSPEVGQTAEIPLGRFHLVAGEHVLRFTAAGKNPESAAGYLMGVDYITARKAD